MREAMINRIEWLRKYGSATHVIFFRPIENPSKRQKKRIEQNIADGNWPDNFDFNSLSDDELVAAFERIVRWAYKSWA